MTTATLESHAHFRLRELHGLFLAELDRRAHDNAVKLLKLIGKETRGAPAVPDVPTSTTEGRLEYWRVMYERARELKLIDRAMELLEHMCAEGSKR
jgi:hypothetical protein